MAKFFEALGRNLASYSTPKTQRMIELADKHGVPMTGGKFFVGAPGVMDPNSTVEIEMQWGSGFVNADKTGRFDEFFNALEATESFTSGNFDKTLYTKLNVYGRSMFAHIINLKSDNIKAEIFSKIHPYATEGLDMNGTQYKDSIKVANVYATHVAPKIEKFANYESNDLNNDLNEVIVVDSSENNLSSKEEKAKDLIEKLEKLKIGKGETKFLPNEDYNAVVEYYADNNLFDASYNRLMEDVEASRIILLNGEDYNGLYTNPDYFG